MPLIHSKSKPALKANTETLMHEMGKSPHVQSREQALAIAYATARRAGAKYAFGGITTPWTERAAARELLHEGFVNSPVPGRTDKLPISVEGGAYVVPSSHVAALGQDNSNAGANILNKLFRMGPYGTSPTPMRGIKATVPRLGMRPMSPTMPHFASGGTPAGKPVDIIVAGGEFIVPPRKLIEKFGGTLDHAHKSMDHWIVTKRKKHAKLLANLPGPKKN